MKLGRRRNYQTPLSLIVKTDGSFAALFETIDIARKNGFMLYLSLCPGWR